MEWKYQSNVFGSVTLHDYEISRWIFGGDITLVFEDGFDVFSGCAQNDTGRHMHTGKAAVILKNARFLSGELSHRDNGTRALSQEELPETDFEVLDFKRLPDSVLLCCDAWISGADAGYCELEFSCADVIYCWNEFTENAWFDGL